MPRLAHSPDALAALRAPTADDPWRVLLSGCMAAWGCGVDGTDYGMGDAVPWLARTPTVRLLPFCPEDVGLGTPRPMPDLHGGDGFGVLDGTARALSPDGADLSAGMLRGAEAMRDFALQHRVDFAVLTDMSGACGTQVISLGCRFDTPRRYQQASGWPRRCCSARASPWWPNATTARWPCSGPAPSPASRPTPRHATTTTATGAASTSAAPRQGIDHVHDLQAGQWT
jgi:uncharacterized protein YbbK (DUF523 family)